MELIGEQGFKKLYFEYHPVLLKVAMYVLKDLELAEDAVQETFLKIWNNQGLLSGVDNPKAYLISVTKNAAFDILKKHKKETILQLEMVPSENDSEEEPVEENFRKALEEAVSKLPPKCRLIFSLSRFEGLSNDEIAEYLNLSKRTVETQISIALQAFRGDLRPIFETWLPAFSAGVISLLLQHL